MSAERELLFGMVALQVGLIDQGALVAAFQAWVRDRSRPLAALLIERGDLDAGGQAAVDSVVALHLSRHGGDADRGLASIPAGPSTRQVLVALNDSELTVTVAKLGSGSTDPDADADRTTTYSVGTSTADGQRFRVLRPHARGGLGAVFVALDGELNREVALKQILDHHADEPISRQRFVLEAEITGGLEHPGIVPVYGLGTYGDGRPYYAMRFIRGDSLKEALQQFHGDATLRADPGRRSLELRKLLRRFLDVCNAIEYAHTRGVLHRDIKPGNIIVGRHGETLVVDWGLARAQGRGEGVEPSEERPLRPASASGSAATLPGSAHGTPGFMSPEQARGDLDALGPRSDVYSLGATLYCLISGRAPFEGPDVGAVLQAVQRGDFPPPRRHDPSIDAPLEAICLKAMALAPADRYESARALAEDVERWLADEPVLAWPEPWARRAGRWLSRHRTGVAASAAALLVALVGLGAVAAVQTQGRLALGRKNTELERANVALAKANDRITATNTELTAANRRVEDRYALAAEAIRTFHTGVSEDFLLKEPQFKALRDRLLRSASAFYERLGGLLDRETDLPSRLALAEANFELATLTDQVGRKEDALAAHRKVLATRQRLADGDATDPALAADLGESLVEIGRLLSITGRADEAIDHYRRAEAALIPHADASPAARAELARARSKIGSLLATRGQATEGIAALELARKDQEALAASPVARHNDLHELAETVYGLGLVLAETGRDEEAERAYRESIAHFQALAAADPSQVGYRYGVANGHDTLAIILYRTGRAGPAEAEYREAMSGLDALVKADPAVTHFRVALASTRQNLAILLNETGRTGEAEREFRAAMADFEALIAEHPDLTDLRARLAGSHASLADLTALAGRLDESEAASRAAIAGYSALVEAFPDVIDYRARRANARANIAVLLNDTGRPPQAEAEYRAAIDEFSGLAAEHPELPESLSMLANARHGLGILFATTGRPREAEAEFRATIDAFARLAAMQPEVVRHAYALANSRQSLGILLKETGRPDDALPYFRKSLEEFRAISEANPTIIELRQLVANGHDNLAELLIETDHLDEAEAELRAAEPLLDELNRTNPGNIEIQQRLASCRGHLGDVLAGRGDLPEAEAEYRRAVAMRNELADAHPEVPAFQEARASARFRLGRILAIQGRHPEAAAQLRAAVAAQGRLDAPSPAQLYALACYRARLAESLAAVGPDARAEFDAAVAALRRALAAGYRDLDALRTNEDLDPIRDRDDFRALLSDLAVPDPPFAPGG